MKTFLHTRPSHSGRLLLLLSLVALAASPIPTANAARSASQGETPPYEGDIRAYGGCAFYDAAFREVCNAFPYAELSSGNVGGFTRVESGDFGKRPLVRSNQALVDSALLIRGSINKVAASLPITVNLQIGEALAQFDGTKVLDGSPQRAKIDLVVIFIDASGRETRSQLRLADDDLRTPAPSSFAGALTVSLDVLNAPRGAYTLEVRTLESSWMSTGDAGTVSAVLDAYVTSIRLG